MDGHSTNTVPTCERILTFVTVFVLFHSLVSNGCHEKEIADAVRTSRNIRHSRERSMSNKQWDPVHEVAEKALRKVTKPFRAVAAVGQSKNHPSKYHNTNASSSSSVTLEQAARAAFHKERARQLSHRAPARVASN